MARQAIRNRWPVSEKNRRSVVEFAQATMDDPECSERARVAAAKLLIDADKVNIDVEELKLKQAAADKPLAVDVTSGGKSLESGATRNSELLALVAALRDRAGIATLEGTAANSAPETPGRNGQPH